MHPRALWWEACTHDGCTSHVRRCGGRIGTSRHGVERQTPRRQGTLGVLRGRGLFSPQQGIPAVMKLNGTRGPFLLLSASSGFGVLLSPVLCSRLRQLFDRTTSTCNADEAERQSGWRHTMPARHVRSRRPGGAQAADGINAEAGASHRARHYAEDGRRDCDGAIAHTRAN